MAPGELPALARTVAALPRLRLRGLMAVPAPEEDFEPSAGRSGACGSSSRGSGARASRSTPSMGMSGDLEAAVAEGATLVRVGTAIFGPR